MEPEETKVRIMKCALCGAIAVVMVLGSPPVCERCREEQHDHLPELPSVVSQTRQGSTTTTTFTGESAQNQTTTRQL